MVLLLAGGGGGAAAAVAMDEYGVDEVCSWLKSLGLKGDADAYAEVIQQQRGRMKTTRRACMWA